MTEAMNTHRELPLQDRQQQVLPPSAQRPTARKGAPQKRDDSQLPPLRRDEAKAILTKPSLLAGEGTEENEPHLHTDKDATEVETIDTNDEVTGPGKKPRPHTEEGDTSIDEVEEPKSSNR
jgi:hypothetical protein